jgi:predicted nucleic acid-binding protein
MMDQAVVDSSVAIKWHVVEPYSAEARRLLDEYQAGSLSLLAPDLIYAEVGNVVWKKHRFQGVAAADAQLIIDAFRTLTFTLTPAASLLDDAFHLAVAHQRTVYDAMYLALSIREKCRLVTADEKMVNALGATFPNLVWIANWP